MPTTVTKAGAFSHGPQEGVSSQHDQSQPDPAPPRRGKLRDDAPWNDPECVTIGVHSTMLPLSHPLPSTRLAHPSNTLKTAVSSPQGPSSVTFPIRVGASVCLGSRETGPYGPLRVSPGRSAFPAPGPPFWHRKGCETDPTPSGLQGSIAPDIWWGGMSACRAGREQLWEGASFRIRRMAPSCPGRLFGWMARLVQIAAAELEERVGSPQRGEERTDLAWRDRGCGVALTCSRRGLGLQVGGSGLRGEGA